MATRKTISGAAWARQAGQKPIAVTLPPDLHQSAGVLAQQLGLRGRSELGRVLFRFALSQKDLGRFRKILGEAIDSVESGE